MTSSAPLPPAPQPGPIPARTGILASLPGRTILQGIAIDVLLALCLVVITATSTDNVAWRLIPLALAKTALMAIASSVMKRVKPPALPE